MTIYAPEKLHVMASGDKWLRYAEAFACHPVTSGRCGRHSLVVKNLAPDTRRAGGKLAAQENKRGHFPVVVEGQFARALRAGGTPAGRRQSVRSGWDFARQCPRARIRMHEGNEHERLRAHRAVHALACCQSALRDRGYVEGRHDGRTKAPRLRACGVLGALADVVSPDQVPPRSVERLPTRGVRVISSSQGGVARLARAWSTMDTLGSPAVRS